MKIRNISPMGDLFVPDLGREVAAGEIVDVTGSALAKSLLEQSDNWAAVTGKDS
jgi:hypothetical protein